VLRPGFKTKLVCQAGVSAKVYFSMFNAHGGKHSSSELAPTGAAGVCGKMREVAIQMGLEVESESPTVLVITGTDRLIITYIHPDNSPFTSPLVQLSVGG
jgi:hypothetical protein